MPLNGREAALAALGRFRKSGMMSENALDSVISDRGVEKREAALAARLFYGVIQHLYFYDAVILEFSTVPQSKIHPSVFDILRITCCQILDFDRIPDFSAVDEGVRLCRKIQPKAAGFVNAVSRRICENKSSLPEFGSTVCEKLSIKYSHPLWLTKCFVDELGADEAKKLLKADNEVAPVFLQLNTGRYTERDIEGYSGLTPHPYLPGCYMADGMAAVLEQELIEKGLFYVQDPAAKMAVMASGVKPGDRVIDVCAAPGGKSFAAGCIMKNRGEIRSFDISTKKIPKITQGAERLGLTIISAAAADGRVPVSGLCSTADVVIADVPCSGFGVIRKKPEIRYKKEEDIRGLPEIQRDIMSCACEYVKPGGVLLYSTCTLLAEENRNNVEYFLSTHDNFTPEDFEIPAGRSEGGMMTLMPHKNGTDGFFICRLRRTK